MKVIVYMAVTLDGFIARPDGSTSFASEIEWDSYKTKIKEIGNVVMGRTTYEQMTRNNDSYIAEGATLVVVTRDSKVVTSSEKVLVASSPHEAIKLLEGKGYETALIGGGGIINGAFLDSGLIDELFIDLEPVAIGSGIALFQNAAKEQRFELIDIKHLSPSELQLHYRALK